MNIVGSAGVTVGYTEGNKIGGGTLEIDEIIGGVVEAIAASTKRRSSRLCQTGTQSPKLSASICTSALHGCTAMHFQQVPSSPATALR